MQRYISSLATVLFFGASFLGMGAIARAQGSARQQPMEIPAQYPQYPQYPSQQGGQYPQYPPQQGGPQQPGGPQQQAQSDPGAARISFIHGDVSTQRGDTGEWVAATLNTPVVPGDHLSTGRNSRGELQLDNANILRMSDESTANVIALSRNQIQLQVGQGLVNFDVLKNSEADVEIQTPNVAIHPQAGEGSFRILVNSDGETIVDVRKGSAEISTPQGSTRVERDQRIVVQGDANNAQYQLSATSSRDEWDKWNTDRDQTIESADSWRHTNPYYTGSQDLDGYGQWNDVPDYGSVWFPQAAPDWAPYRDGRWVYEPYYGWTWVSYEPWGWAPYHYGRWFVYGGRWGWWPGPVYGGYRPVWAPAYVSFLGFDGGGWGVGVGFGSVGWLPCGPGDRFYPWYGRGVSQVNINIDNFRNNYGGGFAPLRAGSRYSNINGAFADGRIRDGVSSMRSDQFGRGRVPSQQQRFDAGSFRQASMITGSLPVSPSRDSRRFTDRQVNPGSIPNRASSNQRFFSGSGQAGRSQAGFNRGGNPGANQSQQGGQQGVARPGFRSFGSRDSGNVNQGPVSGQEQRNIDRSNRQGGPNPGSYQPQQNPQQNADRPGFRSFGSRDSGNVNPAPYQAPYQGARPPQDYYQGQRGYTPPSRQSQPEASPQYQNYSRGNPGNYGYSRPPLNMQQPVVTPRGGSYSASPARSEPSDGGPRGSYSRGGGYSAPPARSAPSGGSYSGGNRGESSRSGNRGESRGGNSGGGHSSSGHDRR